MNIKNNIWKLYVIQALRWFLLSVPILVPFYQSNGLSVGKVLVLQACFGIALAILEIPTGLIADTYGRKLAIVLGMLVWASAWGFYSVSYNFGSFLLAEILLALGTALMSGADSAMLYDTLAQIGETGTYTKREGRMNTTWNLSEGTASVLGGFLALVSLRFPLYIQALAALCAVPVALTLVEPTRKKMETTAGKFKTLIKTIKFGLVDHTEIKWLTIYSAVVSSAGITFIWFIQPRFEAAGIAIAWFGIIWATLQFASAITSASAEKIERKLGRKQTLILLMPLLAISFFGLAYTPGLAGIGIMFIPYFVRGLNMPVLRDYINKKTPEDIRATILSLSGLIMRLVFAVVGPLIGYLNDHFSFSYAFVVAGSFFGLLSILVIYKMHRYRIL